MKNFKEKLKEARIEKGYTQDQLSAIMGIPKRTIEDWERGVRNPPIWTQKMVLTFLRQQKNVKVFEIWDTVTNVKITEILAENVDEAWEDYIENCSEYFGTYDIKYTDIRYKPTT